MAKETTIARESGAKDLRSRNSLSTAEVGSQRWQSAYRTERSNAKRMQDAYGLRDVPVRYSSFESARSSLKYYTKPTMIAENDGINEFTKGFYVVVPSDAARLERNGFKVLSQWRKR